MLTLKPFSSGSWSADGAAAPASRGKRPICHFHCASGFGTQILAYTSDSLVRVSRRDNECHFLSISTALQGFLERAMIRCRACSPAFNTTSAIGPPYCDSSLDPRRGNQVSRDTSPC
eukprot:INCI16383.1.p1 GENE.INCI16383.1~~INCI16383.1.p1  ORF type:complete len:117 (-),score=1.76 INCI16383.1:3697-4047(-)